MVEFNQNLLDKNLFIKRNNVRYVLRFYIIVIQNNNQIENKRTISMKCIRLHC